MSGRARYQLVVGRRRQGTSDPAWPGADIDGVPDGTWYAWRLLSGNNRELGRSARVFPDPAMCRADVDLVRKQGRRLVPLVTSDVSNGMWTWRVELRGTTVALAARLYFRQREATYNLRTFLAAVAEAIPDAVMADNRRNENPTSRHRLRLTNRPTRPPPR